MKKRVLIASLMSVFYAAGAYAAGADPKLLIDESSFKIEEISNKSGDMISPGQTTALDPTQPMPGNPPAQFPPPVANNNTQTNPVNGNDNTITPPGQLPMDPNLPPMPMPPGGGFGNPMPGGYNDPFGNPYGGGMGNGYNDPFFGGGGYGGGYYGGAYTPAQQTVDTADRIVNLAAKMFTILDRNRPVVNIAVNYANAVPYGTSHWTQLQGWSRPMTKKYAFSAKNGFGAEVVKVVYQVLWTYGGNVQGRGKFLTGVSVEPISVNIPWNYKITLTAEVPDSTIANVGTHDQPVAAMQVQLKWKISSTFKEYDQKAIYYVQGDGYMQEIGTPFKTGAAEKAAKKARDLQKKFENLKFN